MLLVIEIALTVFAWRAGWKALSLLPLVIGVVLGFGGGVIMAATGASDFWPALLVIDVAVIAVLGVMVKYGRSKPIESIATIEPVKSAA